MAGIKASVGLRGVNRSDDVRIVQELLNKVPHNLGGPLEPLKLDGLCGRKTNSAIEKLQARQRGWNTVTAIIRPSDVTMKLLLTYDLSGFIDNTPRPAPPPAPPPPKLLSTSFMITVAAKPGQMMKRENHFFMIEDRVNPNNRALYFMGGQPIPSLPSPLEWSITAPPITTVLKSIGVDDWAGDAIIKERTVNGSQVTRLFLIPNSLNRLVETRLHVHIDPPDNSGGGTTRNAPFYLVDSSSTHVR